MSKSRLLLPLLLVAAVHVHASTILPTDVRTQVDEADLIFAGTVIGTESVLAQDGSFAHTYVTFQVEETFKGTADGPLLTLRVAGGQIGPAVYEIAGGPKFRKGDRHLLFVLGNGRYEIPLSGGPQGKLDLVAHPETREPILVDWTGRVIGGLRENQWTRSGLKVDDHGYLRSPQPTAAVLSEDGVKVVLDQPNAAAEATPASSVLAELRALIRSRAFAPEFRRGPAVPSASPARAQ